MAQIMLPYQQEVKMSGAADALEKRVWGFWSTIGFGLLIMAVAVFIQVVVIVVIMAIKAINDSFFSPEQLVELFTSRLGLITAVSTIVYAVVGLGIIWGVIKIRGNASIIEYLGLRAITKKTVLVLLAISL
ncbi:hypothetical protein ACFLRP_05010, partial [Bacteroidota bacterium]